VRARHGPPVRTVRPSRSRARFRVPCGAASAHHVRNLAPDGGRRTRHGASVVSWCEVPRSVRRCKRTPRAQPRTRRRTRHGAWLLSTGGAVRARHGPPVRTVRPSRFRARFRVPCGAASAHHARNLAPDRGHGTVLGRRRPGGAVRARHGPPVRTVRPSRAGARFRVPCGAAGAHRARNLAPDGGRGTVRGRRRPGGAARARHGPPVRTERATRSGARFRVPCSAASSAPRAQPRTRRRRPRTVRGAARVSPRASPSPTRTAAALPAPRPRRAAPRPAQ